MFGSADLDGFDSGQDHGYGCAYEHESDYAREETAEEQAGMAQVLQKEICDLCERIETAAWEAAMYENELTAEAVNELSELVASLGEKRRELSGLLCEVREEEDI